MSHSKIGPGGLLGGGAQRALGPGGVAGGIRHTGGERLGRWMLGPRSSPIGEIIEAYINCEEEERLEGLLVAFENAVSRLPIAARQVVRTALRGGPPPGSVVAERRADLREIVDALL